VGRGGRAKRDERATDRIGFSRTAARPPGPVGDEQQLGDYAHGEEKTLEVARKQGLGWAHRRVRRSRSAVEPRARERGLLGLPSAAPNAPVLHPGGRLSSGSFTLCGQPPRRVGSAATLDAAHVLGVVEDHRDASGLPVRDFHAAPFRARPTRFRRVSCAGSDRSAMPQGRKTRSAPAYRPTCNGCLAMDREVRLRLSIDSTTALGAGAIFFSGLEVAWPVRTL
jgi:hypothetical protein